MGNWLYSYLPRVAYPKSTAFVEIWIQNFGPFAQTERHRNVTGKMGYDAQQEYEARLTLLAADWDALTAV